MCRLFGFRSVIQSQVHRSLVDADNALGQQSVRHQDGCGDVLMLDLDIEHDTIRDAAFSIVGCSGLQACASGMTEMIIGNSVDEAERMTGADIVAWLDGIPEAKFECAEASSMTLREAIAKYRAERRRGG